MRGLKQRSMPTVDDFVATCSVCGAALRQVHVLRGTAGPRCSFCGSPLISARGNGNGAGSGRSRPQPEDDSPLGLLTEFERPRRVRRGAVIAVSVIVLLAIAAGAFLRERDRDDQLAAPPGPGATNPAPQGEGSSGRPAFTKVRAVVDVTTSAYLVATVDDEVVQDRTFAAGERFTLKGDDEVTLRLDDAASIEVRAGGRDIRPSDRQGAAELRLWLVNGRVHAAWAPVP